MQEKELLTAGKEEKLSFSGGSENITNKSM